MTNAPIGIFDSGIGGLTVARAITEILPRESVVYLGDSARVPYGPKSPETVRRYSIEILEWLERQQVKAIVVACNTATAHALQLLRERASVPVVGVVEPGAKAAVSATVNNVIGVVGTAGTIKSDAYLNAILSLAPHLTVHQQACPLFVPLVEEGWLAHPAAELVAREYLDALSGTEMDALVLGCTHYPMLTPLIAKVLGPAVTLIDSATETAKALAKVLNSSALLAPDDNSPVHRWATTDDTDRFARLGELFIGNQLGSVELIDLAESSLEPQK